MAYLPSGGATPLLLSRLIKPAIDPGNLLHPALSLGVFERQDFLKWPMEVIGDVGYLLVQAFKGVAYDSPPRSARSTSNFA